MLDDEYALTFGDLRRILHHFFVELRSELSACKGQCIPS
jgi:hypothetical protein